ncbi:unnamed protein product [Brachionus calyciflorus]|uniref:Factor VIII intron 22 protein n=1 Tax=Brachionus calyciflorus TaxID=104777 RepID=A0A813NCG7_9BILA|nr:unnamed protein product [Brachionus calyciflorus]
MDVNIDYNLAFKSISDKLKKRFLRKPNVSDAIDEYTTLSKQLEADECFSLSASCLQQVAKSYHSVGNAISESAALQSAAKNYLQSEIITTIESNNVNFNEDLVSTISVYEEAIRLHCDQNDRHLSAKLCLELADILVAKFEKYFEALAYYERAIVLLVNTDSTNPIYAILIQLKLAALRVFTCDYTGALNLYSEITNSISSYCIINPPNNRTMYSRINKNESSNQIITTSKPIGSAHLLVEADILKLLLILYLKPTKMKPDYTISLEAYSSFQALSTQNFNYLPITCMNRDVFILLQSFVLACQSNDLKQMCSLQTELWPHFNDVQNYLLNMITDQFFNSSYTDDLLSQ